MTTYISVPKQHLELLQTAAELLVQVDAMHATGVSDYIDNQGVPYQSQYARGIIDRIKETFPSETTGSEQRFKAEVDDSTQLAVKG